MRVDFYVLDSCDEDARLRFACRLSEKAWNLSHRVHALAPDTETAEGLDQLMWTFRAGSFVPHVIDDKATNPDTPVTIGCDPGDCRGELLINLTSGIPPCIERFERIAEIVDGNEASRRAGRERFSLYRAQGYEPQTHKIA
jgi:DNA polymerase-3 subunit chi